MRCNCLNILRSLENVVDDYFYHMQSQSQARATLNAESIFSSPLSMMFLLTLSRREIAQNIDSRASLDVLHFFS
jgi:hypothetical protein